MEREEPPHPYAHYSAGRWFLNQVYIVGWPDIGVVKVGVTSNGRRRYGAFLNRGAEMLSLTSHKGMAFLEIEGRMHSAMEMRWPPAFESRAEAAEFLGQRGGGWLECYSVPVTEWHDVIDMLRTGE